MNNYKTDIQGYLDRLQDTIKNLNLDQINIFINLLIEARDNDKNIFIMGNGGSAATASHFTGDFNKGVSYQLDQFKRFKFICLNDNLPTLMAYANDVSYEDIFVEPLKNFFKPGDLVIGISGSGNSKNVLKAIEYANQNGGKTFGLVGYDGGKLKQLAQNYIHININDMQITEDLHVVMNHLIMKVLYDIMKKQ